MGSEKRRPHGHGGIFTQPTRRPQLSAFGVKRQTVARLELDSCHALGDQRVETGPGGSDQFRDTRATGGLYGRNDAVAGASDFLIGRAPKPLLEFAGAVAAIDEVSMAVD